MEHYTYPQNCNPCCYYCYYYYCLYYYYSLEGQGCFLPSSVCLKTYAVSSKRDNTYGT